MYLQLTSCLANESEGHYYGEAYLLINDERSIYMEHVSMWLFLDNTVVRIAILITGIGNNCL